MATIPTYRSLDVHITDKEDIPLQEYGVRKNERAHQTSCYVESRSNMPFRITIKPTTLPWPHLDGAEIDDSQAGKEDTLQDTTTTQKPAGETSQDPPTRTWADDRLTEMQRLYLKRERFSRIMRFSDIIDLNLRQFIAGKAAQVFHYDWADLLLDLAEVGSTSYRELALDCLEDFAVSYYTVPQAKYHLMAILRLDGRQGWEKRSIIYLDERHPQFRQPKGEAKMMHRTVQDVDGTLRECGWYFTEVGIETLMDGLDKMILNNDSSTGEDDAVLASEDDGLAAAFTSLGENSLETSEERVSAGQIELTFERVTLGKVTKNAKFGTDKESEDDTEMTVDASKIPHITARDAGTRRSSTHDVIYFEPYVPGERPFATFRFYYRNEATLRKMGFLQSEEPFTGFKMKLKKAALSNMAPLSITTPATPRYLFDSKGNVLAEFDVPSSKAVAEKDAVTEGLWVPSNNKLAASSQSPVRGLETLKSPPDSPLDSPPQRPNNAVGPDESDVPIVIDLPEASQSSDKLMTGFRKMENEDVDYEAEEDVLPGVRTPDSLSVENGSANEEDADVGGDGNDEGIGEGVERIKLGKRKEDRAEMSDEEESPESKVKKVRTVHDQEGAQETLQSVEQGDVEHDSAENEVVEEL
ncbi:hypothetical protein LTS10_005373 [Elasticomyces elasticus]|nr:hypothetical protein LTS10_005373 [Elasticomyces elasticus]